MDHRALLHALVDVGGSDLHCKPGSPPHIRLDGVLRRVDGRPLDAEATRAIVTALLPADRLDELGRMGVSVSAHSEPGIGRFRVAAYRQRGSVGVIAHAVPDRVAGLVELGHPAVCAHLADSRSGLILVASAPGEGVTSTVNALLAHVNATRPAHILTVESPIEVLHPDDRSLVSQLEVGLDTPTFAAGVASAAGLDVDVLAVGSLPGPDVARACLEAAAGRLVVVPVRATTVRVAVRRFLEVFAEHERAVARHTLARSLAGVIAQRLLPAADGAGRVLAAEVLVQTAKVASCVAAGTDSDLDALVADGVYHGMQSLDRALLELARAGRLSVDVALEAASDAEEMRISLAR